MTINIETTKFTCIVHRIVTGGNQLYGEYVLPCVDVYNDIIVGGKFLTALYRTAHQYFYNDYSCPVNYLTLYEDGSANELVLVNQLTENDFIKETPLLHEILNEINATLSCIDTRDKLYKLYIALNENTPMISDYIKTMNLDDYEEVENEDGEIVLELKDGEYI